jgi:hypothetical protein
MTTERPTNGAYIQVQIKGNKVEDHELETIKKEEVMDDYGNYKTRWPQQNWNYLSRQEIPFIKPEYNRMLIVSEMGFYNEIAQWRQTFGILYKMTIAATVLTAIIKWRRIPSWQYGLVPTGTVAMGSLYSYSLGYGNMTNRVNTEAFHILNHEYKKYIDSMGDVAKVIEEMKEME